MFQQERQEKILELLKEKMSLTVHILSKTFNVSEVTIRRDLKYLEQEKLIKRAHGGAIYIQEPYSELTYNELLEKVTDEKKRIGLKASELINNGATVFFEASTTVLQIIKNIHNKNNLTVVTNSPHILIELSKFKNNFKVISSAGKFSYETMSINGPLAEQILSEMNFDIAFIGVSAIDTELNMTTSFIEDARIKQVVMHRSDITVGLADFTKFGKKYFASVAPVSALNTLIIDNNVPKEYIDKLNKTKIELIIT
jgi:DeoR family fructose operon transcriptional repressor